MTKMTNDEQRVFRVVLRQVTAWIIDIGRAIKTGNLDDRTAAIDQASTVLDDIAAVSRVL